MAQPPLWHIAFIIVFIRPCYSAAPAEGESQQSLKPNRENCMPVQQLAAQRNTELTVHEKLLLKGLCIPANSFLARQKFNATAFLNRVVQAGIPENVTCEETLWCDHTNVCSTVCKKGSVQQEPWLRAAVDFQWRLARKQPFCYAQLPGSHNSGITLADGYGNRDPLFQAYLDSIAWLVGSGPLKTNNQWLSLTDQLNMGVRNLELDTHWVAGHLRIAHCGGLHLSHLNTLVRQLNLVAKLLGHPIRWDTETMGCQPSLSSIPSADQRTVRDALEEVRDWFDQPANHREFVVIFFDDQLDIKTWGKVPVLLDTLRDVFGEEAIVTPREIKQGRWGKGWPSVEQFTASGKKLLLVSGVDYGVEMSPLIFPKHGSVCGWFEPHLHDFSGPSTCQIEGQDTGAGRLSRVLSCEITYGPLNCDFIFGNDGLVLDKRTLPDVSACSVNMPSPDRLTPGRMESMIWSWEKGHPYPAASQPLSGASGLVGTNGTSGASATSDASGTSGASDATRASGTSGASNATRGSGTGGASETGGVHGETELGCAAVFSDTGRWRVVECIGSGRPTACRRPDARMHVNSTRILQRQWSLSWGPYGRCPPGYEFEIPQTGRENVSLMALLRARRTMSAWLPLRAPDFLPPSWKSAR